MRKNSFFSSLFWSIAIIVAIIFPTIFPQSSYGQQCVEGDGKFISTGPSSALLYWSQGTCSGPEISVYYQTSFDKLKTWTEGPQLLFGPFDVEDFDGIVSGSSTLVASYAVVETVGGATIYVLVSKDKGKTWSDPIKVVNTPGGNFRCPTLETQYSEELKRFILRTNIYNSNSLTANMYIFSSSDGLSWTVSTLGGSNFPTGCKEDD